MKAWIAIVSHRHGRNVYAARTKRGLNRQLYEYVKESWSEITHIEGVPAEPPRKHLSAITMYFDSAHEEYVDLDHVKIED